MMLETVRHDRQQAKGERRTRWLKSMTMTGMMMVMIMMLTPTLTDDVSEAAGHSALMMLVMMMTTLTDDVSEIVGHSPMMMILTDLIDNGLGRCLCHNKNPGTIEKQKSRLRINYSRRHEHLRIWQVEVQPKSYDSNASQTTSRCRIQHRRAVYRKQCSRHDEEL